MGFLAKGDQLSFIYEEKSKELVLPPNLVVLHDVEGNYAHHGIRTCDFFIAGIKRVNGPISRSNLGMRQAADEYHGGLDNLSEILVDLARDGWELLRYVDMIRYHREGFLKEDYEHRYSEPQPLFQCKAAGCYKIVSPDGCIAGPAGFELP